MACTRETQLLLSRYANGEASASEGSRAAAHLAACPECRELMDEWQGQRQLLVWASTLDLPELTPERLREIAQKGDPMPAMPRSQRSAWPHLGLRPARAFATAVAAVTLGLAYQYAARNALFVPRLANGTTLGSAAPRVRVRNGAVLELASGTRVTRLGEDRIRLDAGWLRATVRHGAGLRIQTKRLDVRDVGTIFQMNAGESGDSVTVEEGEVSVYSGGNAYPVRGRQMLFASGDGKPEVGAFPAHTAEEDEPGQLLYKPGDAFVPSSDQGLDWSEGLQRLAAAFPDARCNGASGSNTRWPQGDSVYRISFTTAQGARAGIRAHFAEIARAQSGAATEIGTWSFPVAYLMVDNVVNPQGMSPDAYQVEMMANGSRLFWRYRGSRGAVVDTPLTFERKPKYRTGGTGLSSAGNVEEDFVDEPGQSMATAYFRLMDWPGALKPTMRLELRPLAGYAPDAQAMQSDLARLTAGVPGLKLEETHPSAYCLDPSRSRRLMVAWNAEAGRQVEEVLDGGRGGSVLMGALTTEQPCLNPQIPAGTYLLRWTQRPAHTAPVWEIVTLDGRQAAVLPAPRNKERDQADSLGGGSSFQSVMHTGLSRPLNACLRYSPAKDGAFLFRFALTDESSSPPKFGEGWLRVKQP